MHWIRNTLLLIFLLAAVSLLTAKNKVSKLKFFNAGLLTANADVAGVGEIGSEGGCEGGCAGAGAGAGAGCCGNSCDGCW